MSESDEGEKIPIARGEAVLDVTPTLSWGKRWGVSIAAQVQVAARVAWDTGTHVREVRCSRERVEILVLIPFVSTGEELDAMAARVRTAIDQAVMGLPADLPPAGGDGEQPRRRPAKLAAVASNDR